MKKLLLLFIYNFPILCKCTKVYTEQKDTISVKYWNEQFNFDTNIENGIPITPYIIPRIESSN